MQFSYRGATYENDIPTGEFTEGEIGGKYRGQDWRYSYPRHIQVPQPTPHLRYRGVNYCPNPRATAEACFTAPAAEESPVRVMSTSGSCRKILDKVEETHLANIRRRLEYRLQVARDRGDRDLLRMLERESKQLVRQYC